MKNRLSESRLNVVQLLKALLLDPDSLRLGISGTPENRRYALVRIGPQKTATLVAWGNDLPLMLRLLVPAIAHADTGFVPVHLFAEEIGGEDPDAWIDRNEGRTIPPGFIAGQMAIDYVVDGTEVIAMSAVETARDGLLAALEKNVTIASLLPPLQGLAWAYRNAAESPWVLWKIDTQGSVLGRIEGGKVKDVCHYWADLEALTADPSAVTAGVAPLLRSIAGNIAPLRVMCWTPAESTRLPDCLHMNDCRIIPPPQLPGIPRRLHEAYGNALFTGVQAQLLPFHKRQKALAALRAWRKTLYSVKLTAAVLAILAAAAAGSIGVNRLLIYSDRTAIRLVDEQYNTVRLLAARRDSLRRRFEERAAFAAGESALTRLLSDLQEAVPEGMRAEELTIAERDGESWRLTVRAFAQSSSLLQQVIGSLQAIKGIEGVRMVYSEQVSGKGKGAQKGIRVKIEAVWR
ncbi:MAG: hypothetical protein JW913_00670 [Chitinispirillaceae bacterium]|nr:hypothetical protein [Chitinispirillaceae bacterium]